MNLVGSKTKYDAVIARMLETKWFRVTRQGHIESCYQWRGVREWIVPWYRCDRLDGKGYRYVSFRCARVKAHRLAYALYTKKPLEGLEINHLDGDRLNNRRSNLELCDARRQSQHAFDIGLNRAKGETHPNARFKDTDIVQIRHAQALGVPKAVLARRYNVTPRTIALICFRETWKHIP